MDERRSIKDMQRTYNEKLDKYLKEVWGWNGRDNRSKFIAKIEESVGNNFHIYQDENGDVQELKNENSMERINSVLPFLKPLNDVGKKVSKAVFDKEIDFNDIMTKGVDAISNVSQTNGLSSDELAMKKAEISKENDLKNTRQANTLAGTGRKHMSIKELRMAIRGYHLPKKVALNKMKKDQLRSLLNFMDANGQPKTQKLSKRRQYGAGIFDFLTIKTEFNNESKKTLSEYGSYPIQEMIISKTRIFNALKKVIKSITGFDSIYHLALVVKISTVHGDKYISLQKRQQVEITDQFENVKGETATINIKLPKKSLTIDQLVNNAISKVGRDQFFKYDAIKMNCQRFVYDLLKSSNLGTQDDYDFFMQEVSQLADSSINKALNIMTDTGAIVSQLMGKGHCCEKCGNQISV